MKQKSLNGFRTPFIAPKRSLPVPNSSTIISIKGPKIRVTICETKYFTCKEFLKVTEALCVLVYVLNSDEFQTRLMASKFTSTRLSNEAIYDTIMKANEEAAEGVQGTFGLDNGDDSEVDLLLTMYSKRFSRVVGYTLPANLRIWINRKFFSWYKPWQVAGNLFHEWTHNLGFDHVSASDSNSVPYLLGDVMEELGEKHYQEALAKYRPLIETHIYMGRI
jgi:hypothetical protein